LTYWSTLPLFLAVRCEDDIAGIKFDDLLPAHLDQAVAAVREISTVCLLVRDE
jgi:hypothetical protein